MNKKVVFSMVFMVLLVLLTGCLTNIPPILTVPAVPSDFTALEITSTSIKLTWVDNSNNETGFEVERSMSSTEGFQDVGTVGANVITFTDQNLTPATTYFYRVKAVNTVGESAPTTVVQVTTESVITEQSPTAPVNLTAQALSGTEIKLTWTDLANNETGFKIYRSTSTPDNFSLFKEVAANVTEYVDTGLMMNGTYYYYVKAFNAVGESSASNTANATTDDETTNPTNPPAAPVNLTAQALSSTEIKLTWTDLATNETGFKIYRSTSATGTFSLIQQLASNITQYSDTGLIANTTYYYYVKANNADGDSTPSNTANATTAAEVTNTATLRVYNNTRYYLINLLINDGSGNVELINNATQMVNAGTYKDYEFTLSANSVAIHYEMMVGFFDQNGRVGRFMFWGDTTLEAGKRSDVTIDISLSMILSNFKVSSDWLGYYWYDGLMYYKFYRMYDSGMWELCDNGQITHSGTATLTRWDNYSDFIYFQLEPNGETIMLYYPSTKFYVNNGPTGWQQIEYVLQVTN